MPSLPKNEQFSWEAKATPALGRVGAAGQCLCRLAVRFLHGFLHPVLLLPREKNEVCTAGSMRRLCHC